MPFSQQTIDFLIENRLRDSRAWFAENHERYQRFVIEPLRELVVRLTPCMRTIDAEVVTEPRVDKTICRIWRDTRYSHDKLLYRDTLWIIFKRGRMHSTEAPGLYFEIGPDGFNYGTGFYAPSSSYMQTLRAMVLAGAPSFQAAQRSYAAQDVFRMEGECFKRARYPDQPEALRVWLERRSIGFYAESADFDLLFSDGLADRLSDDFARIAPVYRFLMDAALEEKKRAIARPY